MPRPSFKLRPLSSLVLARLSGLAVGALAPGLALAGPAGGNVVAGQAAISTPNGATTVINQSSQNAAINWQQFSVGGDEFVLFNQPSASATVLNRVIGGLPSEILGNLSANGRVFLINPSGVLFGAGARVDVAGLVASTLDIADADFMAGRHVFVQGAATPAAVRNEGQLSASAGGFVVLAGERVENSGLISAAGGDVLLASGSQLTLSLDAAGLVGYSIDAAALSGHAGVENLGEIVAAGGSVVLAAETARSLLGTVINNQGRIRAGSVEERDGEIYLLAEGGDIVNGGTLDVSGSGNADGGRIELRADRNVTLAEGGRLLADGAGSGDGGEIRLVAEEQALTASGSLISATAGPAGRLGGFVELSGHRSLQVRGELRLGRGGRLLIDPTDLTIANGSGGGPGCTSSGPCTVAETFIEQQLQSGADVALIASNSITMQDLGDDELTGDLGSGSASRLFMGIGTGTGSASGGNFFRSSTGDITFLGGNDTVRVGGRFRAVAGTDAASTLDLSSIVSRNEVELVAGGDIGFLALRHAAGGVSPFINVQSGNGQVRGSTVDSSNGVLVLANGSAGAIDIGSILAAADIRLSAFNTLALGTVFTNAPAFIDLDSLKGSIGFNQLDGGRITVNADGDVSGGGRVTARQGGITIVAGKSLAVGNVTATSIVSSSGADARILLQARNGLLRAGRVSATAETGSLFGGAFADVDLSATNGRVTVTGPITTSATDFGFGPTDGGGNVQPSESANLNVSNGPACCGSGAPDPAVTLGIDLQGGADVDGSIQLHAQNFYNSVSPAGDITTGDLTARNGSITVSTQNSFANGGADIVLGALSGGPNAGDRLTNLSVNAAGDLAIANSDVTVDGNINLFTNGSGGFSHTALLKTTRGRIDVNANKGNLVLGTVSATDIDDASINLSAAGKLTVGDITSLAQSTGSDFRSAVARVHLDARNGALQTGTISSSAETDALFGGAFADVDLTSTNGRVTVTGPITTSALDTGFGPTDGGGNVQPSESANLNIGNGPACCGTGSPDPLVTLGIDLQGAAEVDGSIQLHTHNFYNSVSPAGDISTGDLTARNGSINVSTQNSFANGGADVVLGALAGGPNTGDRLTNLTVNAAGDLAIANSDVTVDGNINLFVNGTGGFSHTALLKTTQGRIDVNANKGDLVLGTVSAADIDDASINLSAAGKLTVGDITSLAQSTGSDFRSAVARVHLDARNGALQTGTISSNAETDALFGGAFADVDLSSINGRVTVTGPITTSALDTGFGATNGGGNVQPSESANLNVGNGAACCGTGAPDSVLTLGIDLQGAADVDGSIQLQSHNFYNSVSPAGDISTGNLTARNGSINVSTHNNFGNGGANVVLGTLSGGLNAGDRLTNLSLSAAGDLTIANTDVTVDGNINLFTNGSGGFSHSALLKTTRGRIDVNANKGNLILGTVSAADVDDASISLTAAGKLTVGNISSLAQSTGSDFRSAVARIHLDARNGALQAGKIVSNAETDALFGGAFADVDLTSTNGRVTVTGPITTSALDTGFGATNGGGTVQPSESANLNVNNGAACCGSGAPDPLVTLGIDLQAAADVDGSIQLQSHNFYNSVSPAGDISTGKLTARNNSINVSTHSSFGNGGADIVLGTLSGGPNTGDRLTNLSLSAAGDLAIANTAVTVDGNISVFVNGAGGFSHTALLKTTQGRIDVNANKGNLVLGTVSAADIDDASINLSADGKLTVGDITSLAQSTGSDFRSAVARVHLDARNGALQTGKIGSNAETDALFGGAFADVDLSSTNGRVTVTGPITTSALDTGFGPTNGGGTAQPSESANLNIGSGVACCGSGAPDPLVTLGIDLQGAADVDGSIQLHAQNFYNSVSPAGDITTGDLSARNNSINVSTHNSFANGGGNIVLGVLSGGAGLLTGVDLHAARNLSIANTDVTVDGTINISAGGPGGFSFGGALTTTRGSISARANGGDLVLGAVTAVGDAQSSGTIDLFAAGALQAGSLSASDDRNAGINVIAGKGLSVGSITTSAIASGASGFESAFAGIHLQTNNGRMLTAAISATAETDALFGGAFANVDLSATNGRVTVTGPVTTRALDSGFGPSTGGNIVQPAENADLNISDGAVCCGTGAPDPLLALGIDLQDAVDVDGSIQLRSHNFYNSVSPTGNIRTQALTARNGSIHVNTQQGFANGGGNIVLGALSGGPDAGDRLTGLSINAVGDLAIANTALTVDGSVDLFVRGAGGFRHSAAITTTQGRIDINASGGDLVLGDVSATDLANDASIRLDAAGKLTVGKVTSRAQAPASGFDSAVARIHLQANNGALQAGAISTTAETDALFGGAFAEVDLSATNGRVTVSGPITTSAVDSGFGPSPGGNIVQPSESANLNISNGPACCGSGSPDAQLVLGIELQGAADIDGGIQLSGHNFYNSVSPAGDIVTGDLTARSNGISVGTQNSFPTGGGHIVLGKLSAPGIVSIGAAGDLVTNGAITGGTVQIGADRVTSATGTQVTATAGAININSSIQAPLVNLDAATDLFVSGTIDAGPGGSVTLTAHQGTVSTGAVTSDGLGVTADVIRFGDLNLSGALALTSTVGEIRTGALTAASVALDSATDIDVGVVTSTGAVSMDAATGILLRGAVRGSSILVNAASVGGLVDMTAAAGTVDLNVASVSAPDIRLTGRDGIDVSGVLNAGGGSVTLVASNGLLQAGGIQARNLAATAAAIDVAGLFGTATANLAGDLRLTALGGGIDGGALTAGNTLDLTASGAIDVGALRAGLGGIGLAGNGIRSAALDSSGDITAHAGSGALSLSGSVDGAAVTLTAATVQASGLLDVNAHAGGLQINAASIGGSGVRLEATGALGATGNISGGSGDVALTAGTTLSVGAVSGNSVRMAAKDIHAGAIAALQDIELDTAGGTIGFGDLSGRDISVRFDQDSTITASLVNATGSFRLDGTRLGGDSLAVQAQGIDIASGLDFSTVELAAGGALQLGTETFNVASFSASGATLLASGSSFSGNSVSLRAVDSLTLDFIDLAADAIMLDAGTLSVNGSRLQGGALDAAAGGALLLQESVLSGSTVTLRAGSDLADGGASSQIIGDALGLQAGGRIDLRASSLKAGTGVAVIGGDAGLLATLSSEHPQLLPQSAGPNLSVIADTVQLGSLELAGDYLYIEADAVEFAGSIAAPPELLVQFKPRTLDADIGVEAVAAQLRQVNLNRDDHFNVFPGTSFVIGGSGYSGDVHVGENAPVDLRPRASNFVFLSEGSVTGADRLSTNGSVVVMAATPPPVVSEPSEPFEPPLTSEFLPEVPQQQTPIEIAQEPAEDDSDEEDAGGSGSSSSQVADDDELVEYETKEEGSAAEGSCE